jgi:hypothetical protein
MSRKTNIKVIARCSDYYGNKNVLVVMDENDFRLAQGWTGQYEKSYERISLGVLKKSIFETMDGTRYRVFPDSSAKSI